MEAPIEVLLQHWPGVLFRQAPDQRFQFVSDRIEEWTGHPAEAWLKEPELFLRSVHEEDADRIREHLARPASATAELRAQFRFRHAETGRVTHVGEFRRVVCGPKGRVKLHEGFWQDESRLARAERRLEAVAWKEILSRITPGFAHDFNNVIAGVHGLSETFLSQLEPEHPFRESLALVKKKTQDASQFVQRLQQLHLPRTSERAFHDLNALVKDAVAILGRGLGKRVEVGAELADQQLPIHADAAELQQVIFALAFNAADAMPERGRLVLRTSAHAKAPEAAHFTGTLPSAPCVCLSVQDSGSGIKARHLPRVFEPDFTTRPGHHGLGLGLSHARHFAASHRGALSVESADGKGATFHLWLPRADLTEAGATPGPGANRSRIVLLSGRPAKTLREVAEALRAAGVRVVIAEGDAEEWLAAADMEFDAVVLQAAPNDAASAGLVQFIRRHRLPVKIVVQPAGCADEDLDPKLLEKADLVIAESVSPERVAERIGKELFGR